MTWSRLTGFAISTVFTNVPKLVLAEELIDEEVPVEMVPELDVLGALVPELKIVHAGLFFSAGIFRRSR